MNKYKYVIIGGGIAGTTAAENIREKDSGGTIAIIGDEKYPLYSRVLLPNVLKNRIDAEKVFLRSEEDYLSKKIDTFFETEVEKVDFDEKVLVFKNGDNISYEKLLITSGGRVRRFDIAGVDPSEVLHFQSFDDTKVLKEKILQSKKAVIIGNSFISLELAEAFHLNNIEVSMLIRGNSFWKGIMDDVSSEMIRKNIEEKGISLFFDEEAERAEVGEEKKILISKTNKEYEFDILGVGVGIERNIEFLENSGIEIKKGIVANEYLETNIEDVFTAGDVAEFYDVITDKYQMYGNWPAAFLQGKIAGLNMTGEKTVCRHISGYNIVSFGLNVSFVGDVMSGADKDTIVIKRGNIENNEYSQLFIKNNKLVGATQLNMNKEKGFIVMLIDKEVDLSKNIEDLKDSSFDLKSLIS